MTAEEVLRGNEQAALAGGSVSGGAIRANLTGRIAGGKKRKLNVGAVTAGLAVILVLVIFLGIFSSANYMIDAISTRLIEETDVQYADAVQSKALVFQEALEEGEIPANTAERLEAAGVTVGYLDGSEFVASRFGQRVVADLTVTDINVKSEDGRGPLSLKIGDKVIPANEFFDEVNNNAALYAAFTEATYSRAAYYYDEDAQRVFREIGTTRNNFSEGESLEETMSALMGEGNNVAVNDRTWHYEPKYCTDEETGETYFCGCDGPIEDLLDSKGSSSSSSGYASVGSSAPSYMTYVAQSNMAGDPGQASQNTADALKASDTVNQDQKSMLLYLGLMENISKTKAGDGNQSQINDVMNFLYADRESVIVDPNTGLETKATGTMLESPSLYAVLTGSKLDVNDVTVTGNSNDRILKTVGSQGLNISNDTISKTVLTTNTSNSGIVGRYTNDSKNNTPSGQVIVCQEDGPFINNGGYGSDISSVTTTVQNSMYDNSFSDIGGYNGGELLVQGAVNVGRRLANASGAAPGDEKSVTAYMKVTESVLAMDAEVDRMNRSPFDVTSRNTFLGSIVWNFAMMSIKSDSVISKMATVARVAGSAMSTLMPSAKADDANTDLYLNEFGDCATLKRIGAAGSATCAEIATFDVSTYKGIYQNGDFKSWIGENLDCNDGTCEVVKNSELAKYIEYNEKRTTPVGLTDGGIVEAIQESGTGEQGDPITRLFSAIRKLLSLFGVAKEVDNGKIPDEATGAAFVNSASNSNWSGDGEDAASYKYAQRYIALSRAISNLRQYDGDETAYNFKGFGKTNAVIAYINEHYPESVVAKD